MNVSDAAKKQLDLTFRISTIDAVFASMFMALGPGSIFFTKLLNELNPMPIVFSIMVAIGPVASAFLPLGVAVTKNLESRKKSVVSLAFVGRALTLFIALVPLLFFSASVSVWLILTLYFLSNVLLGIAGNAWTGWIADNVPLNVRGRFFSIRSQYSMIAAFLIGLLFSIFVDLYDPNPGPIAEMVRESLVNLGSFSFDFSWIIYALCIVLAMGGLLGMIGALVMLKQPEAPKPKEHESYWRMLLHPMKDHNFLKLLVFALWWMLAVGIGAPFWQPYMLNTLQLSLTEIQIYGMISTIAAVVAVRFWGKIIDTWGNKPSMFIAIILGGINPILWVWANGPETRYIIFAEAMTSGVMWSGTGIIVANFVLAIAPPDRKQMYSGLFGMVSGIGAIITMIGSGLFLSTSNAEILGLSLKPEQIQFGLGGILRWTAIVPLLFVQEINAKPVGQVLYSLQQFAKVQLTNLILLLRRTKSTGAKL